MESCHSLPPRVKLPALGSSSATHGITSYSTIGHLVNIIEQLKNKDKIISHLERELGHQSGYALQLALDRETTSRDASPHTPTLVVTPNMDLSSSGSNSKLGDGSRIKCDTYLLTYEGEGNRAIEELAHLQTEIHGLQERCDCLVVDNQELSKKLKDIEQKNRQLNEKNKKFLDKNVELTSHTRNLKDQTQLLTDDYKKLKDQHEHSKRKCQQLVKQLYVERSDRSCLEEKIHKMDTMKQQITDQDKTITSLKQSCSEKDRRIELIQHRKKRRRLMRSQEKCTGVKETFYGYDEDSRSENSENSLSSVSWGTISDDEIRDEISREEIEKNYQRLMREHNKLQKSHALLQSQTDGMLDPQRESKMRGELEMDLFRSQCRIEELEKILQDTGQGEASDWLKEKEQIFTNNEELRQQMQLYEGSNQQLQQELLESQEQVEDLEFRILELEECQPKICECGGREVTLPDTMASSVGPQELGDLEKQLRGVLEGRGGPTQELLGKLGKLTVAQQTIYSLECTAKELQSKVIYLQQEKTTLEEMLLSTQQGVPPSPNRNETVEVLALKDQLNSHEKSEVELMEKNNRLQSNLEECEQKNGELLKRIQELEDKVINFQTKHGKPMNRTDSEKEKIHERYHHLVNSGTDKKDKNSQTYTDKQDKCVSVDYEEPKPSQKEFELLDQKVQTLYEENLSLKRRIEEKRVLEEESGKSLDFSNDSRLVEMEEYCEDLQDRLQTAEMSERQLREKLKLAEHTINEIESSETYFRDKVEELTNRESEAKRQMSQLCQTVQELKEIVLDKDVVETALHEKVDFLEKAELASAQIIQELQNSETSLRRQLELKSDVEGDTKFAERLKNRVSVLERENKKLSVRVSELEEDEEVLRENWRRVADEDANRIQCLEEKVKIMEGMNKQLKNNLKDAQDGVYIRNNIPQSSSLASELSESEKNNGELTLAKRSFSTPYLHSAGLEVTLPQRSLSQRDLDMISEAEGLEKIQALEEQIENIVEDKNSKIETLHEKVARMRENEVKLTETLMEMEHQERELKAKVALYESSAITVEKMLQYEDKILELHSSQENLLDRLESLEDHEMTLQEKLEKTEQQSKIKVGTLENKLKSVHSQLELAKQRGEELVKEKEHLKSQIDKLENKIRLYVRKGEEAKEKISELNGKISVYEQRESFASEKLKQMENSMNLIQQKEETWKSRISELEAQVKDLREKEERARMQLEEKRKQLEGYEVRNSHSATKLLEFEKHEQELTEKVARYSKSDSVSKQTIQELESQVSSLSDKIVILERELSETKENEKARLVTIENMEKTQTELSESLKKMRVSESNYAEQISSLEQTRTHSVTELERQKRELSAKVKKLEESVHEHDGSVRYLEQKLSDTQGCERVSAEKVMSLERTLAEFEQIVVNKTTEVKELEKEKTDLIEKFQELDRQTDELECENRELKDKVWNLERESESYKYELKSQTDKDSVHRRDLDSVKDSLGQLQDTNRKYETQIQTLSQDVESFRKRNKDLDSEMEKVLSVKCNLEKQVGSLSEEVDSLEKENEDLRTKVSTVSIEKDDIQSSLDSLTCDVDFLNGVIGDLKFSVKSLQTENSDLKTENETSQTECFDLKQKLTASKSSDGEIEKRLKNVSEDIEVLENTKKELLKSVLGLENEKERLTRGLEAARSECEALKVKWNESCENEKNLRDKLTLSESEQRKTGEQVKLLEEKVKSMKVSEQKVEADKEDTASVLKTTLEKNEELEHDQNNLKEQLVDVQERYQKISQKMEILQDAEAKLMDRVMELEQVEVNLKEQLEKLQKHQTSSVNLNLQSVSATSLGTEVSTLTEASPRSDTSDQSTSTADLPTTSPPETGKRVSGMFQRLQELEFQNRDMSLRLQDYESTTAQLKQMKDKVKLLEESEDKLMERVMELEESEDQLKTNVRKLKRLTSIDETDETDDPKSSETESSELQKQFDYLKAEKEEIEELLKEEHENREKTVKDKNILLEELQHLNDTISKEKEQLEEKIKLLERTRQKEEFRVDSLQSSESFMKKDMETLKQEKKKVESEMKNLQSQMIDFQSQIVDLENQLQTEKHKVEIVNDKKIKMEEKMKNLEKSLEKEQEKSKKLSSAESVLVRSMSEEKSSVRNLEIELRMTQERLEEVQDDYEKKVKGFELNEKNLKSAINAEVQKEQKLQEQVTTLKAEISEVCDKSKELEDKVSQFQTENSSLKHKCDSLIKDNEELSEYVKASKTDVDSKLKSLGHPTMLPKISSNISSTSRTKDLLKKPLSFGAVKPVQSFRERELQGQVVALEAKQKELLDTISRLEKVITSLKGSDSKNVSLNRSSSPTTVTTSLYLTPSSGKFGTSRYTGTKESTSEDLLEKVHKLEEQTSKEREKAKVVEDKLAAYRAEVRNLKDLVTGEKTSTFHGKTKSVSLHQMPEITSLEMELKRQMAEIQHREQTLRSEVSPISVEKLKHKVVELEASEAKLKQKVVSLQLTEDDLKKKLKDSEKLESKSVSVPASRCDGNHGEFFYEIDNLKKNKALLKQQIEKLEQDARNRGLSQKVEKLEQAEKTLKKKVDRLETQQTSTVPPTDAMLDKPEDVLMQQIRELEKLDKHHRQQISDLETDREELHEIARKDKSTIHDQNVRIRELQLSEKVLREQMDRMETSESELYQKCEALETKISKMEDANHLLQVHERRLRELVKKLKLDEELWIAKSENMEMTVDELAASEVNLKKRLEEIMMEKMTLSQKSEYLSLRCQELESSETQLFEKVRSYENVEVSLQNKLMVLERSEQAANSKISELDMMNMDISTRLQRAVEENAVLYNHIQGIQGNLQEINRELLAVKDSEIGLKQQVESMEKNEIKLQRSLKEFELRDIDLKAKVRQLEQTEAIMKDRISNLQRGENKLKYRIQELEGGTKQIDGAQREKLPRTLEECHKRIVALQSRQSAMFSEEEGAIVKVPKSQLADMQAKMVLLEESELQRSEIGRLNSNLQETVSQLRQGKGSCGHEAELDICRSRIASYENAMQRLSQILPTEQVPSLLNPDSDSGSGQEDLPARGLQTMESERVMQTMRGLAGSQGSARMRPLTQHAEDPMPSDLSSVEEEKVHQAQGSRTRPQISTSASRGGHAESPDAKSVLEEQWKKIESKKPRHEKGSTPLGGTWRSVGKAVPAAHPSKSTDSQEEMMIGVTLHSESDHSHYRSQNDTDSDASSPQMHRATASTKTDSFESQAPPLPKTLPPSLPTKLGGFAHGSYQLPSSDTSSDEKRFQSSSALRQQTEASDPVTQTMSVDSVADSGQGTMGTGSTSRGSVIRDRIAQLEKQLQSKSSGAESRTDEEDSVFTWKQKALQPPKNIEIIEKENKNIKDEINKLERDVEEKRRCINTFELWMNSSEEMLKNQNKYSDRDVIQNLQTHLVNMRSELQHSGFRREDILHDPAAMKTELDKRDREIAAKTNEIRSLTSEILKWQEECQRTEEMRANALDSLRCLEVEISHLQTAEEQLQELRREHEQLRGQMDRVEQLKQEVVHLQDKMADTEAENNQLKNMKDDYDSIKSRFEEVERLKTKAMMSMSPLKAQVSRLSRKCREKDELIRRLGDALRNAQMSENLSSLLEELDQFETSTDSEEYYRPHSPYLQGEGSPRLGKIDVNSFIRNQRHSGRRSSSSSLSDSREHSDNELSLGDSIKKRPKSADHLSGRRSPFQGILRRSINANNLSPRGSDGLVSAMREKYGNLPDTNHFVAITDHIPDAISSGGQPSLELRIHEGDTVKVTGPLDENGYYEAECNGQLGLVPASCLQPAGLGLGLNGHSTPKERRLKHLKNTPSSADQSPEQVTEMFQQLQSTRLSPRHGSSPSRTSTKNSQPSPKHLSSSPLSPSPLSQSYRSGAHTAPRVGAPDPPRRFHVVRLVGESGILLSWIPPQLDELGNSNNSQVVGYKIYLNGRLCQEASSPHLAKCVIEQVDQDQQQHLAIQTLASNGQMSPVVDTIYRPTDLPHWGSESEPESDPDLSSVLSSRHYDPAQKRLFLGLYDYAPNYHSPHNYTGHELGFRAGDVVSVFGRLRPDGFYHGEVDGKRGLVPSSFIEEIPSTPRHGSSNSLSSIPAPRSGNNTLRHSPRS